MKGAKLNKAAQDGLYQQILSKHASIILRKLEEVLPKQPNESDFQKEMDSLLEEFCKEAGLSTQSQTQYTLATGRADAVFNRFVIEYKRPGTLGSSLSHQQTERAVNQVKSYITGLAKKQKQDINRIGGVAFDGRYIVFVLCRDGDFSVYGPKPVTQHSLEYLLRLLAGISSGIALTAENLKRDFNIEQLRTKNVLRALYRALNDALQAKTYIVHNLFEHWRLSFNVPIDGSKMESLKKSLSKDDFEVSNSEDIERFFFVLDTYYALLIKLIAREALSHHFKFELGEPSFVELATENSDNLRYHIQNMEDGGIFRTYGLLNLLEGDLFSWYLYAWDNQIEDAIRELLKRLSEYDFKTLTITQENTSDLFKSLHHCLLPREIRHNLGEYYTPDGLAQYVLNLVDEEFFTADPEQAKHQLLKKLMNVRFLDPACGSGTFLVLIIARMKELGRKLMVDSSELLNAIITNVVGIDINPAAVITAKVNYLLAIADLLAYRKGNISIPVYLADSIRKPALAEETFLQGLYKFETPSGTFLVPEILCTKELFPQFCDLLEESIKNEIEPDVFLDRIKTDLNLDSSNWTNKNDEEARELYEQILYVDKQGLIARILKNNFAPLTIGEFDYIVGNPPWVNWENLPVNYRNDIIELWHRYNLKGSSNGGGPRLGMVKGDIAALMTYVAIDRQLKEGGRLGFVITQTLFKTAAGAGFRRFKLPSYGDKKPCPIKVVSVDDMVALQLFEGATTRTAVMVLEKGSPTTYPVKYTVWRKNGSKSFTYDSTLDELIQATKRLDFVAEPVNPRDPTSPWLTVHPRALSAVRKVLGRSDYKAHLGANTGGANAVYWVELKGTLPDGLVIVRNITEGAKIKINNVNKPIEPALLYPLLRGGDIQRWQAKPSAWIIVPQDPKNPARAYPESRMQKDYIKTYGYLKSFEQELRNRSGWKQILSKKESEFYGIMDVGTYTFAPWKVVWPNIASSLVAAVIGEHDGKPVVPQHIVTLVACKTAEEAHYVCALVNSSLANFVAKVYSQEGGKSFGTPHILEHIRIPLYDPSKDVHQQLSKLSQKAHATAEAGNEAALIQIEADIDQAAAELWGLTDDELKVIQQSLAELEGEEVTE
ncbi:MAG: SAM-dependent DNA methyltransferase [Acidobacteria bacterium]|nr:MAG: SAM-dependent DNA methyltransferase [Acidobacteriota bacterium]